MDLAHRYIKELFRDGKVDWLIFFTVIQSRSEPRTHLRTWANFLRQRAPSKVLSESLESESIARTH